MCEGRTVSSGCDERSKEKDEAFQAAEGFVQKCELQSKPRRCLDPTC